MTAGALLAHAGHPAEWLPFAVPLALVAVAWLVIRAREAASEDREEDARDEARAARTEDDRLAGG